jgi:hypothetical protein
MTSITVLENHSIKLEFTEADWFAKKFLTRDWRAFVGWLMPPHGQTIMHF